MKHLLAALLLTGCTVIPEGVRMSEAEIKECKEFGCAVWSERKFNEAMRYIFGEGVKAGLNARGKGI